MDKIVFITGGMYLDLKQGMELYKLARFQWFGFGNSKAIGGSCSKGGYC